ncbi:hypothetical protein BV25DRAFT_1915990 [Artomyces pyxidatus]|uniref:Uncharacterized protein n=1 Tax=Artomyces pyxidatus TaxID=48021 RepID=A0ACB8T0W4_9AGAM|nr:hypothetical protein BV25DRAFT_1915990 [Artomyces pyxidatus]
MLNLPDEILLDILEDVGYNVLLTCQQTCRRLNTLITTSVPLQYTIELAACGMLDGERGPNTLDIHERLRLLVLYDEAWRKLDWTRYSGLTHLVDRMLPLSVAGTALVLPSAIDILPGHPAPLLIQRLPSFLCGVEEQHNPFARLFPRFTRFDASQDLCVGLDIPSTHPTNGQCCLLSILTGDPHPLAHNGGALELGHAVLLDLCGDYLLESHYNSESLWISLTDYYPGARSQAYWDHRGWFLDDKHILLDIRLFHGRSSHAKCLFVVPFRHRSDGDAPVYMFSLPELLSSVDRSWGYIIPGRASGPLHPGHFHADPDERLISMYCVVLNRDQSTRYFVVDIPVQTFISYVRAHPAAAGQHVAVPWDAWGTHGARVMLMPTYCRQNGMLVSGMRRIDVPVHAPYAVTVVDYHPRRVARAIAREDPAVVHGAFVDTEKERLGEGGLRTLLPCIVTKIPLPDGPARCVQQGRPLSVWFDQNGVLFVETARMDRRVENVWAYTI